VCVCVCVCVCVIGDYYTTGPRKGFVCGGFRATQRGRQLSSEGIPQPCAGFPQCKIYCWLNWVFFVTAFTEHLKHCQECYFLNASEAANAKLHFPVLEIYF
jgi:hypothetical protein